MSKFLTLTVLCSAGAVGAYFLMAQDQPATVEKATAISAVAAEAMTPFNESPAPYGIDEALEEKTARFFYCPKSNPADLALLAYKMSSTPEQVPTLTRNAGCEAYTDPTSWSGPMLSLNHVYGQMHSKAGNAYFAGSFTMGNPAGSGGTGDGVAVWQNANLNAPQPANIPDLTSTIRFQAPRDCEISDSLKKVRDQYMNDGPKVAGPLGNMRVTELNMEGDLYTKMVLAQPFMWNDLKATSLEMISADFGFFSLEIQFQEPLTKVRQKLKQMGYPVYDDGRVYEQDVEGFTVEASLKSASNGAAYQCNAFT